MYHTHILAKKLELGSQDSAIKLTRKSVVEKQIILLVTIPFLTLRIDTNFIYTTNGFTGVSGLNIAFTMSAPKGKETNDEYTYKQSLETDLVLKVSTYPIIIASTKQLIGTEIDENKYPVVDL